MDNLIFLYFAFILLVGLLSTRLMKWLKMPNVTGFIVTGILIGPFVFGLLFNNFDFLHAKDGIIYQSIKRIHWVSDIALGFIAFVIGSSFKLSSLRQVGKRVMVITALEALGASLLVFLALLTAYFIFPESVPLPLVFTLSAIASATAPAATLMVIKQYHARGPVTRTLLPVVALDDAAALILFAILFQIAKAIGVGSGFDPYAMFLKPLIEVALSIAFGLFLGLIISLACRLFLSRTNRLIWACVAVLASVGLYYLFKMPELGGFELSSLLTCMASGAVFVNMRNDSAKTFEFMDRFTAPIYMAFFVISGASLDLTIFASETGLIVLAIASIYLVFRVIGKWIGAFSGAKLTKAEPEVQKWLGLTLVPQAGVAIGLATSAGATLSTVPELQSVGALIVAIILTSTLIYELTGPLVTKFALTKAGEIPLERPASAAK